MAFLCQNLSCASQRALAFNSSLRIHDSFTLFVCTLGFVPFSIFISSTFRDCRKTGGDQKDSIREDEDKVKNNTLEFGQIEIFAIRNGSLS